MSKPQEQFSTVLHVMSLTMTLSILITSLYPTNHNNLLKQLEGREKLQSEHPVNKCNRRGT